MEIKIIEQADLEPYVVEFLGLVCDTKEVLEALGEFPDGAQQELRLEFVPEQLRNTFAIEGIVLDPQITRAKMQGDRIAESEKYSGALVENALRCVAMVESSAHIGRPITIGWFTELHRDLMAGESYAGTFRVGSVEISGTNHRPPDHLSVRPLLEELCSEIEAALSTNTLHPIVLAVWAHVTFAQIHPFEDGNGRTARFLQDYVLTRGGYFPVGVPASKRQEYYDSLALADRGEWSDIVELVADSELAVIRRTTRVIERHRDSADVIQAIVGAIKRKQRNTEHVRFEIWKHEQASLLAAVEDTVTALNDGGLSDTDWLLRSTRYTEIDFEGWHQISEKGYADRDWLLRLVVSHRDLRGEEYSLLLHARRHDFRRAHDTENLLPGQVATWIIGPESSSKKYDWFGYSDNAIGIREVRYSDGGPVVYLDPSAQASTTLGKFVGGSGQASTSEKWIPVEGQTYGDIAVGLVTDLLVRVNALGDG